MYTFTNKLRNFSIILMIVGFLGLTYGFLTVPDNLEEATTMVADAHHGEASGASNHDSHGQGHQDTNLVHNEGHGVDEHGKHLLHQLQNKPWAALYVAAFFFMMIALGTLAFYAINRAAQAGWSPALFRVMECITA